MIRRARIVIVGGGPGGLFLARLIKLHDPGAEVTVYERNPPGATFGFGVVFSERTLSGLAAADALIQQQITGASASWSGMEMRYGGERHFYDGYGFSAIARQTLLNLLQEGAREARVDLRFEAEVGPEILEQAEIVVAADGVNSSLRSPLADRFGTHLRVGGAKFAWFGTTARFDVVTFPFVSTEHGMFAAHAYPYDDERSTFIVEVDEETWARAALDEADEEASKTYLEAAFAEHLGGEPLLTNKSLWSNFGVVSNERWHIDNLVLLGDAAHTAHFSVGSGTKMAMEDAVALADALASQPDRDTAFRAYEAGRRPAVTRTQRWAAPSQYWWETFSRRNRSAPTQFGFHFLTRTGAMTYRGLRRRDAAALRAAEEAFVPQLPRSADGREATPPGGGWRAPANALTAPLVLGERIAPNRLMVRLDASSSSMPEAFAHAGAGTVLAPVTDGDYAWADRVRQAGALAAGIVAAPALQSIEHAAKAFDLIELPTTAPDAIPMSLMGEFLQAADDTPLALSWTLPVLNPYSSEGDRYVTAAATLAAAGVSALRFSFSDADSAGMERDLRPHPALPGLGLCDRIRQETGLIVALDLSWGWAVDARVAAAPEALAVQAHVALVAGRVDLFATWPVSPLTTPAPVAPLILASGSAISGGA
jgi:2-polyprenyl-6-methoxyphenol hydroxylase-like FAD-dependent oxidoreductase